MTIDTDGEQFDDPAMEKRLTRLESDVGSIRLALALLEARSSDYATKADLRELQVELRAEIKTSIAEAKNAIILWVVGAVFFAQLLPALFRQLGLQ